MWEMHICLLKSSQMQFKYVKEKLRNNFIKVSRNFVGDFISSDVYLFLNFSLNIYYTT